MYLLFILGTFVCLFLNDEKSRVRDLVPIIEERVPVTFCINGLETLRNSRLEFSLYDDFLEYIGQYIVRV